MRTPFMLLLVVLLAANVARANAPPPLNKEVPREIHVEFTEQPEGCTLYVVSGGRAEQVPGTVGDLVVSRLVNGAYVVRKMPFRLCAVPNDLLASPQPQDLDSKWFQANIDNPRLRWATFDPASEEVSVTDPRVRIVQRYRVRLTPTAIETELVSEEVTKNWSGHVVGVVTAAAAAGFVVLWIWHIRRHYARGARTTPPPGY